MTTQHTDEPDAVFLASLSISEESARRKVEVYEEARQLRREVFWLEEEPSSRLTASRLARPADR